MHSIEDKSTDKLNALRAAVLAKLAYWDAMHALEHALQPEKEFSDRASDRLVDFVDNLACGMPDPVSPQHVAEAVTEEELTQLNGQLRGL